MQNFVKLDDGNIQMENTGEVLTPEEFEERFVVCKICGQAIDRDGGDYVEPCRSRWDIVCADCAKDHLFQCDRCDDWFVRYERNYFEDSDAVWCDDCTEDHAYQCERCGEHFRYEDSGLWCGDDWYCDSCNSDCLYEYHEFKKDGEIEFCGAENRSEAPYMGFELEVDSSERVSLPPIIRYIRGKFPGYFHLEEDGSLNYGFECISQPASLSHHMGQMPEYKEMFGKIVEAGLTSHNNARCGLHVHIDREFFGTKEDASIAKMLFIFEKWWDNLLRFSRRKLSQVHWCDRYSGSDTITEIVKKQKRGWNDLGRYHALNLTNDNTIEVRLWRGTLKPETFEATLRFTDRLARLCRDTSAVTLWKMTWEEILGDDEAIKTYWETVKDRNINN